MAKRAAVLVGTAQYTHLPLVPAAANSLERMHALLTGPLCGWSLDDVKVLLDQPAPGSIPDQLVQVFSEAQDVALFYFVGHGQPDHGDRLCLSLVDTRTDATRRYTTSLPFDAVRDAMTLSPARFKVILLDCCYAGLAIGGAGRLGPEDERDVLDRLRGTGAFVVAACGPYSSAWFENDPANPKPYTHFTKRFADVVEAAASTADRDGLDEAPRVLTLGQLVNLLAEELAADGKPAPTWLGRDQASELVFATYPSGISVPARNSSDDNSFLATSSPLPARWGGDLPASLAYVPEDGSPVPDALNDDRLYPDVPASVREISDSAEHARTVLEGKAHAAAPEPLSRPVVTARAPRPDTGPMREPAGERVNEPAKTHGASPAAGEATAISAAEFARRLGRDSQQAKRIINLLLRDSKSLDTLKSYDEWFKEAFPGTRGPQRNSTAGTRVPAGEDTPTPNRLLDDDPPTVSVGKNVTSPAQPRRRPASPSPPAQPVTSTSRAAFHSDTRWAAADSGGSRLTRGAVFSGDGAPSTVLAAVWLMYAGAAASLATTVASLIVTSSQWWSDYPVSIIVWILVARASRNGWRPTQAVGSVLFGIATLILFGAATSSQSGIATICDVVVWLVGLGAVICLWQPSSTEFFLGLRENRRLPYGPW